MVNVMHYLKDVVKAAAAPRTITVVQFTEEGYQAAAAGGEARLHVGHGLIDIRGADGCVQIYNGKHGSWITLESSRDHIRVDDVEDAYPIAADYFKANYTVVES